MPVVEKIEQNNLNNNDFDNQGGQSPAPSKSRSRSSNQLQNKNKDPIDISISISESHTKSTTKSIKEFGGFNDEFELYKGPKDTNKMKELIKQSGNAKVKSRTYRVIGILFIPIILLSFNEYVKNDPNKMTSLGFTFGISLLFMFTLYFVHIFWIFFNVCTCNFCFQCENKKNKSLFRVYSLNTLNPEWTNMSFTYHALIFKQHPIQSISEFSAVMGGIANPMLLVISCYSMAVLICGIAAEHHYKENFKFSFGCFAELFGCYGLALIGTFELDPFTPIMRKVHNSGAAIGLFTIMGYFYQMINLSINTNNWIYLWSPIVITLIGGAGLVSWQYHGYISDTFCSDDARKKREELNISNEIIAQQVTALSLKNVISEAIFLYSGAVSMCLWLAHFEKCSNMTPGCKS